MPIYNDEQEYNWEGWLDSEEFAAYSAEVKQAIRDIGRAGIGDIKRHFESPRHERWLADAIESLSSTEDIRQVAFGSISRWSVSEPRTFRERKFNGSDSLKKGDAVLPYAGVKRESPTYSYNK